jgi:hypothetical protein
MLAKSLGKALLLAGLCLVVSGVDGYAAPPTDGTGSDADPSVNEANSSDDLLMKRERYFYSSFARRDPFGSLISGSFASTNAGDLLDIGELTLVGVVWGEGDRFAVVQDQRDHVHVLRVGDRVVNGKVIKVTHDALTVQHYFFGETANVTIKINQGEGK